MKFAIILLIAVLLYALLKVLRIFLLDSGKIKGTVSATVLLSIELFLWISFFFLSVDVLFSKKSYYNYLFIILVVVLVVLLSWFLVKELIAGALFKIQYHPRVGKQLKTDNQEGTITKISATFLTLETTNNELVRIPYSRIQSQVITLGDPREQAGGEHRLKVRIGREISKESAIQQLKNKLLHSPYCSFKKSIRIRPIEESLNEVVFEITFSPISPKYVPRIETLLKNATFT